MPGVLIAISLTVVMVLFQNMTLVNFNELGLPEVDEKARQDQARELMGSYYKGSLAQKLEGQQYLNYLVYKRVDEGLKGKWKKHVPALVQAIISESQASGLDPVFVLAVIQTESVFNPEAIGRHGEIGLMQILPATGEWIARKNGIPFEGAESLRDPATNIRVGVRYFAMLRNSFEKEAHDYVPAYNMGPANLRRINKTTKDQVDKNGELVPREYAARVMKNYYALYAKIASDHSDMERIATLEDAKAEKVQ